MTDERLTYTVDEAAALLGVHRITLYDAIREGKHPVPFVRVGARIVIPKAALDKLLAGEAAEPERQPEPEMPDANGITRGMMERAEANYQDYLERSRRPGYGVEEPSADLDKGTTVSA